MTGAAGSRARTEEADANYDEVQMDLSEVWIVIKIYVKNLLLAQVRISVLLFLMKIKK